MIEIQASEAKTHLLQLLTRVEHGESIRITRHGKTIARLIPEENGHAADFDEILRGFRDLRKRMPPTTIEEIIEMKNEGRK